MFGPTLTGWSVVIAAQKAHSLRSFSAWNTELSEMNFMRQYPRNTRAVGIGRG
jgi:hypothetical protein